MVTGHQNTIKKTVLKKKSNTSIESDKDLKLSIQFSLDGFSFCISESITKEDLFFTEYIFDNSLKSPEELLENITSIFKSDQNLQLNFKDVFVIHQNNLNTLIPEQYFDDKKLIDYLNFNIKTLKTDFAAFDQLTQIKANNVFIPYVNINNYLFQHFGEFEYKHHTSVLIDKFLPINKDNTVENIYVNVTRKSFDIIVLKDNKLLFTNTFSYQTKEDFLYYILFASEQLNLDTSIFNLYFTGTINKDSELYKLTYSYIKNIFFLESSNKIFKNLDLPNHSNLTLLYR